MSLAPLQPYQPRPVRYAGLITVGGWRIKAYSISVRSERVDEQVFAHVRKLLPKWLEQYAAYPLDTYGVGTLILHEGREGCFAIISWWIDSNMLQTFVYLATDTDRRAFRLFSDRGIFTCVWELAVHWHERNAWVKHVLGSSGDPTAFDRYLNDHFNADI